MSWKKVVAGLLRYPWPLSGHPAWEGFEEKIRKIMTKKKVNIR